MSRIATPTTADLAHIPHLPANRLVGHTLDLLKDPYGLHGKSAEDLGPVYKIKLLGQWRVAFAGIDAMELILEDKQKCFSSFHGWDMIQAIFPGGLMLQDFENHRASRRIMQSAFRKPVMDAYRDRMDAVMPYLLAEWPTRKPFRLYPAIKELSLRIGTAIFMGLAPDDPRVATLNAAFQAEVAAGVGVIRKPLPGTALRRGLKARDTLLEIFRAMIPERRAKPGDDFFSQMCQATDEDGVGWSDQEIVDQFNFLMMAAHDTTASTIAKVIWALVTYPEWQERLREEVDSVGDGPIEGDALAGMDLCDRVMREALRLMPPVPFIPRRTLEAFEWQGYQIPEGTWVSCLPGMVMMSPEHFTNPEEFDPDRFSPNRAEHRKHKYAWSPFGGGAHKCIGMHFATLEVKLFLRHLLSRYRVELAQTRPVTWSRLPTPKPKGGLPVRLVPRTTR